VHAPTEGKYHDTKDSFYEELEPAFDQFPKYHMKMLKGYFSANFRNGPLQTTGINTSALVS
jgi:hypothetical protein